MSINQVINLGIQRGPFSLYFFSHLELHFYVTSMRSSKLDHS